jgi:hypothetical protein
MAIATSTALAIGGMAISAGTAGLSFAQAAKQRRLGQEAAEAASKAMSEARRKLDVNYQAQASIMKEPYELQREAMIASGAQATQAGVESERGAAATAGRVAAAQAEAQAGIRSEMGKELMDLEQKTITEQSRLRDMQVNLDLAEVTGAQQAAAQAEEFRNQAIAQGVQGLSSVAQQAIQMAPLYEKTGGTRQFEKLQKDYNSAIASGKAMKPEFLDTAGKPLPFQQAVTKMTGLGFDVAGVGGMNPMTFEDYMIQQGRKPLLAARNYGFLVPQK